MIDTKKYNVNMTLTDAKSGLCAVHTLHCGELSMDEIQKYLQKLQEIKSVPKESCFHYMEARFNKQDKSEITLAAGSVRSSGVLQTESDGELKISIVLGNKCWCPKRDCLYNVQHGLCKDAEGMIPFVGIPFLPQHYSK